MANPLRVPKENETFDGPCRHSLATRFCDPSFDVVCPFCTGHFFKHSYIPFLISVALLVTCYFWRPLQLRDAVYLALAALSMAYMCAVLRRRPGRAFLTFAVGSAVSGIALGGAQLATLFEPAGLVSVTGVLILALIVMGAFVQGAERVVAAGGRNGSPLMSAVLLVSVGLTLADFSLGIASAALPFLEDIQIYAAVHAALGVGQRYKAVGIGLTVVFVIVWAVASAVPKVTLGPQPEATTLRADVRKFMSFCRLLSATIVLEIWITFKDTLRHTWLAASSCLRVFALAFSYLIVARALMQLGAVIAELWDSADLWADGLVEIVTLGAAAFVVSWFFIWITVIAAFARDKRNLRTVHTLRGDIEHAFRVLRFSLLRSSLVASVYLSLTFFVAWLIIAASERALGRSTGLHVGVIFLGYAAILLALGCQDMFLTRSKARTEPPAAPPAAAT